MEGIELGLIGYGIWGELILRDLLKLGIRVAVCDIKSSRRDQAVKAGANGIYSTVESMPKVEGLIIATPACSHASVIAALDDTGNTAPLFVEKPLTASISDAKMLLARSGAPIFVMHIWTYHAGIRKLKELLQSGIIGTPTVV